MRCRAASIALTPQWGRWIDELVASGEYQSASEVIRDGLRALRDDREHRQAIACRDALIVLEFFHRATDLPRHLQALAGY